MKHLVSVSLDSERPTADIRYTTDGTEPTARSPRYTGTPLTSRDSLIVKARLFEGDKMIDAAL